MTRIRILVANHDFHLREALLDALNGQEDMQVVGEARDSDHALHLVEVLRPDILLLDALLHGGMDTLPMIAEINPGTRILVFADPTDVEFVVLALEQGAPGCMSRAFAAKHLIKAIHALHQGELWAPRRLLAQLLSELLLRTKQQSKPPVADAQAALTDREQEILRWVARGMTNKEIAKQLGISDLTVKSHLQHIYAKLGIHRRLRLAIEQVADRR
ncbi:LuxR C-terminal-related transcriptional regulator [Zobellella iuensis]|uniref:Response regulator transcription factor n=1 Tax=Zobellella iuensis TaxID=2803811 RepID=A0ABS1QWQ7_9GAMM|nr:response regulator transcription factor [Zobellella iuensis]MBL1379320.1 response regulator transcription factor [Zobellella iuensis]